MPRGPRIAICLRRERIRPSPRVIAAGRVPPTGEQAGIRLSLGLVVPSCYLLTRAYIHATSYPRCCTKRAVSGTIRRLLSMCHKKYIYQNRQFTVLSTDTNIIADRTLYAPLDAIDP